MHVMKKVSRRSLTLIFYKKKQYLVTRALVLSRRNAWAHAQTSIFIIESQRSLGLLASQASWLSGMPLVLQRWGHCCALPIRSIMLSFQEVEGGYPSTHLFAGGRTLKLSTHLFARTRKGGISTLDFSRK